MEAIGELKDYGSTWSRDDYNVSDDHCWRVNVSQNIPTHKTR